MKIFFSGICGTAMASAAVALKNRGIQVIGSDKNIYPPMSDFLAANNITVLPGYNNQNIVQEKPDLVVIGNALSRGNPEVEYILANGIPYTSLPELLKKHFIQIRTTSGEQVKSLVVCGTHGKTTTTSLLTWVFEHNQQQPSYLIGGIPNNLTASARFNPQSPWFIIEGDEYDTAFFDKRSKFIHYCPHVAILNNLEFDHADIFENLNAVKKTFRHLINTIPGNGLLLYNGDDANLNEITANVEFCPKTSFGFGENNNVIIVPAQNGFRLSGKSIENPDFLFTLPPSLCGQFNIRNATAVALTALHAGLFAEEIQNAFNTFKGIKRRMEIIGCKGGITVIDDFGHHPTAIAETLVALQNRHPQSRLISVFEPRSNTTRRNVFQKELINAFKGSAAVIIGTVAREEQLPAEIRLNVPQLVSDIAQKHNIPAMQLKNADEIIPWLLKNAKSGDVICIFSNGQFDGLHKKLLSALPE